MPLPTSDVNLDPATLKPVHIGLMGHIDAGKTAIARRLSEIQSTAGLDKHPQSQKRGITIDLGFTFFALKEYMVTIVDAPGHADLIKSVVSGANIIDIGVLVIDGLQGPQVQTGEHLIILDLLEIPRLIIVINKIDSINSDQLLKLQTKLSDLTKGTRYYQSTPIISVSAKSGLGFDKLKDTLYESIKHLSLARSVDANLLYLIDHHFGKKGKGTVVTGTVLSGRAEIGDTVTILPLKKKIKIKSIQKWKQSVNHLEAGDRCGVALSDITPQELFRGCLLTDNISAYVKCQWMVITLNLVPMFKSSCRFGQEITITHQMRIISGRIFPFQLSETFGENTRLWFNPGKSENQFKAVLWLDQPEFIKISDKLLLTRLDLSPKSLRIMGKGIILSVLSMPITMYKIKTKSGMIKNPKYTSSSIIAEGLAESQIGAQSLLKLRVENPLGYIQSTFGQKGNVEIILDDPTKINSLNKGESVILKQKKPFKLDPKISYDYLEG